jgi:mannonate dehydratase
MPLISLRLLKEKRYITAEQAEVLAQLRQHNSLLFDFVLKRQLRGQGFGISVFHTRSLWTGTRA